MSQFLSPPVFQIVDANGVPISGAKLNVYVTGTTTPIALFANDAMTTPTSNPLTADASGIFPAVYLTQKRFKAVITTESGVVLRTIDPVFSSADTAQFSAADMQYDNTASELTSTTVQGALDELSDILDDVSTGSTNKADKSTTITGGGLAAGGGSLAADRVITVTEATEAQAKAGTATDVVITPRRLTDALTTLLGSRLPLAWVDMGDSGSMNASFNVTSATSISGGVRLTFTTALPANYAVTISGTGDTDATRYACVLGGGQRTTTTLDIRTHGRTSVVIYGAA